MIGLSALAACRGKPSTATSAGASPAASFRSMVAVLPPLPSQVPSAVPLIDKPGGPLRCNGDGIPSCWECDHSGCTVVCDGEEDCAELVDSKGLVVGCSLETNGGPGGHCVAAGETPSPPGANATPPSAKFIEQFRTRLISRLSDCQRAIDTARPIGVAHRLVAEKGEWAFGDAVLSRPAGSRAKEHNEAVACIRRAARELRIPRGEWDRGFSTLSVHFWWQRREAEPPPTP